MSTDLVTHSASTELTIDAEQSGFSDQQVAVLQHLGVEGATEGDLDVFFHVVKRTQLDPFARQIYMIGRNTYDQRQDKWVTKQTIQTGIDGYRLIGRRAADRSHVKISVSAPEWAHQDGTWRPVWIRDWGMPIAARVTITRDGEPFTGVALFDEYKQIKRNGELTSMWAQRPAGQIAKCSEALAWRLAFPQDLAGVYVEEEMQQADREPVEAQPAASGVDRLRTIVSDAPVAEAPAAPAVPDAPEEDIQDAEVVEDGAGRDWLAEAAQLTDVAALRALYAEAAHGGASREVGAAIARRGADIERGQK